MAAIARPAAPRCEVRRISTARLQARSHRCFTATVTLPTTVSRRAERAPGRPEVGSIFIGRQGGDRNGTSCAVPRSPDAAPGGHVGRSRKRTTPRPRMSFLALPPAFQSSSRPRRTNPATRRCQRRRACAPDTARWSRRSIPPCCRLAAPWHVPCRTPARAQPRTRPGGCREAMRIVWHAALSVVLEQMHSEDIPSCGDGPVQSDARD
jgi:hypothetical protein